MKLCDEKENENVYRKRNEETNEVESHVESHEECLINLAK